METPEIDSKLQIGIGEKEQSMLEAKKVTISKVRIVQVGDKKIDKVVCSVKHPDKEELIDISAVKYEPKKDTLKIVGLWFKTDEDQMLQKGSATATFISYVGADSVLALVNCEAETVADEQGYLVFKAY